MYCIFETRYSWSRFKGFEDVIEITLSRCGDTVKEGYVSEGFDGEYPPSYVEKSIFHGKYETLDAAREAVTEIFGAVRPESQFNSDSRCFKSETYWPSDYKILTLDESRETAFSDLQAKNIDVSQLTEFEKRVMGQSISDKYLWKCKTVISPFAFIDAIDELRTWQMYGHRGVRHVDGGDSP